jgi:antitoxin (DNA-binding transcriptional repressor) of toxin-antitoxin stability system
MNATIVDLRYRMKEVLRAIDRGETVTVLYRGKEKARLMPVSAASSAVGASAPSIRNQPIFGLWKDRDDLADPAAYVRNLRQPRAVLAQAGGKQTPRARKPK